MRRYELSDEEWGLIEDLLPRPPRPRARGRRWRDHRQVLNGIFWVLRSGSPWRDLPERYGPWQTCYDRFVRWRRDGTFGRMLCRLHGLLEQEGLIDWRLFCVDGTNIRAAKAAAGARHKRGGTRMSRQTTRWAAAAAGGAARSTWSPTRVRSRWRRS
jgi:transposase